jgi:hypothetical protein
MSVICVISNECQCPEGLESECESLGWWSECEPGAKGERRNSSAPLFGFVFQAIARLRTNSRMVPEIQFRNATLLCRCIGTLAAQTVSFRGSRAWEPSSPITSRPGTPSAQSPSTARLGAREVWSGRAMVPVLFASHQCVHDDGFVQFRFVGLQGGLQCTESAVAFDASSSSCLQPPFLLCLTSSYMFPNLRELACGFYKRRHYTR